MAPKRSSPLDDPPAASSSEVESEEENEEQEDDSEEEEESEEEEHHHHHHHHHHHRKKKASSPPRPPSDKKASSSSSKKPDSQPAPSSSDDDSESDSDSDSDNPPSIRPHSSAPDPNVKPIASKPMDDASKLKKPRSKPSVSSPTKSSAAKRPADNNGGEGKDSKRAKKKDAELEEKKSGEDSKKQHMFQRSLWSEDDEIAILKGMIEYKSKKGIDPLLDMSAFHDFIKKSLHADVARSQLAAKVRRLKKKYENNLGKGKKGEDRSFSNPHEQKAYDLSKKVWGSEVKNNNNNNGGVDNNANNASNGKSARSNQKSSKRLTPVEKEQLLSSLRSPNKEVPKKEEGQNSGPLSLCVSESIRFSKNIGVIGLDEEVIKQGLDLIGESKTSELEEKWRKLQMADMELFLKRVELIREQTKLVLDAHKGPEH